MTKTRRKSITLNPVVPSQAVELDLLTALNQLVASIIKGAREAVVPVAVAEGQRLAAKDDAGANARSVIEYLKRQADIATARADRLAREAIQREAGRHTKKWVASVASGAQIDVSNLLRDDDLVDFLSVYSEQVNGLIKNLSNDILARIERETLGAIFEGRSNADISKSLQGIGGIGRNRARLIARDQASKLNGAMNQFRQEQAGVTHYKWRTVLDGRERPHHHERNGKIFPWAKAPSGGHPGREINCRCRALPVLIDDPADAAGIVETPDAPDVDDLVAKAGQFGRIDVDIFGLSRDEVMIRRAGVRSLATGVDALRTMAAPDADLDRVFAAVFGFATEGQDLARLAGLGVSAAVKSRASLVAAAIRARLDVIDEALEHAAATAPDVRKRRPGDISADLRSLPAGRMSRRLDGQRLDPADAVDEGAAFTVAQGRATGHEWGYIHDQRGNKLGIVSSALRNSLDDLSAFPELFDPRQRLTVHHNHPSSSAFSATDIRAFGTARGIDTLYAHGHDGSTYRVRVADRSKAARRVDRAVRVSTQFIDDAVRQGKVSALDASDIWAHLYMLVMRRKRWVSYDFTLRGQKAVAVDRNKAFIEHAVAKAAASLSD